MNLPFIIDKIERPVSFPIREDPHFTAESQEFGTAAQRDVLTGVHFASHLPLIKRADTSTQPVPGFKNGDAETGLNQRPGSRNPSQTATNDCYMAHV